LKETVTAGNWPTWLMSRAAERSVTRAMLASGTGRPEPDSTNTDSRDDGPEAMRGSASSTTRYWLAWVKSVEIWRWPNAL
jgi:hypothetical protein